MLHKLKIIVLVACVLFSNLSALSANPESISEAALEDASPYIGNVGRGVFSLTSETFDCRGFLKSVKRLPVLHIAVLYNTFGNDFRCWDRIAQDPRLQTIELNLINEPGHRNGRLGTYEFLYGLGSPSDYDQLLRKKDQRLKRRFVKYVRLARAKIEQLPKNVQCLINPGLESNVSPEAGATLIEWTREQFPNCRTVWNPLTNHSQKRRAVTGADFVEAHGPLPKVTNPCVTNLDGTDIDFPERATSFEHGNYIQSGSPLMQYLSTNANKCEVVFLWVPEDNCNYSNSFVDPRKRNCRQASKVFPLVAKQAELAMKQVKQYTRKDWTENEQKSLNDCAAVRSAADGDKVGFLLKQSEYRNRGGVVILPRGTRAQKVEIVSRGNVLDRYEQSGTYDHDNQGRPMWRSLKTPTSYPFHVVVRVKTNQGNICYPIDNPNQRND